MKKSYLCLLLFSALMFTAFGQRLFNGGTNNLFSETTNWKDDLTPDLTTDPPTIPSEITQINQTPTTVTVDADFTQTRVQTNTPRTTDLLIEGTGTLTIDSNSTSNGFGAGNGLAINFQADVDFSPKLTIDCPVTLANTGSGKWSRANISGSSTFPRTIEFTENSVLTLEKLKNNLGFVGVGHQILLNGTITGGGDIGTNSNLTFGPTFASPLEGFLYLITPANVTVNSNVFMDGTAGGTASKIQANSSATVTLNTPYVFTNELEINSNTTSGGLTLNVNANQNDIGLLRTRVGSTLTINLGSNVTEFSCKNQNNSTGAWDGSIAINGFREGVVRFGTLDTHLTTSTSMVDQLAKISTDAGEPIVSGPDGYLYFASSYVYYNGSWSTDPAVTPPTAGVNNLIIKDGVVGLTSATTCRDIIIAPGAGLTFPASNSLTSSSVTLESTSTQFATFIINKPTGTLSLGDVKYKRYVSQTGASVGGTNDLISSPVSGQTFGAFASDPDNSNLSASGTLRAFAPFDKATGSYMNYDTAVNTSTVIESGEGYRVATNDGNPLTFTGGMQLSDLSIPISYMAGVPSGTWNFIGNPYSSYLELGAFLNANSTVLNSYCQAVYGYDGAVDSSINSWTVWDSNVSSTNLIAPGQGFYVVSPTAGGNISFTTAMRRSGGGDDFISGRVASSNLAKAKINISTLTKNGFTNLYFRDINTRGLDPGYDTGIGPFSSEGFGIYSRLVEDNQGIDFYNQSLAYSDLNDVVVPLGVNSSENEPFSISIDPSSTVPSTTYVYLEDSLGKTLTLLSSEGSYTHTPEAALSGTGRYFLRFSASALDVHSETLKGLEVFAVDKTVYINGTIEGAPLVLIHDLQGRQVSTHTLESIQGSNRLDLSHLNTGLYIVSIRSINQQLTQKVIIKN